MPIVDERDKRPVTIKAYSTELAEPIEDWVGRNMRDILIVLVGRINVRLFETRGIGRSKKISAKISISISNGIKG